MRNDIPWEEILASFQCTRPLSEGYEEIQVGHQVREQPLGPSVS